MGKPDNGHGNQQRKLRSTGNGKSRRQRIRNNLNGRPRSRGEPHNGLWEHGLGGHWGHASGCGYSTNRNGSRRNGWPGTGGTIVTGRADGSVRGIFRYRKLPRQAWGCSPRTGTAHSTSTLATGSCGGLRKDQCIYGRSGEPTYLPSFPHDERGECDGYHRPLHCQVFLPQRRDIPLSGKVYRVCGR